MEIKCDTLEHLVTITAGLVREGVTFNANSGTLIITLTGGY